MGMFDDLKCDYPLPAHVDKGTWFQTKDTPAQALDKYWIDESGKLWHEQYDIEDRSDPDAEGIERICGMCTRVNKRWEPLPDFSGPISFYAFKDDKRNKGWTEFLASFVDGQIQTVAVTRDDPIPVN